MRSALFLAPLVAALLAQGGINAQKRAAAGAVEPVRTAGGVMTGKRIEVRRNDWISSGRALFVYTLTSATISDGRLEFSGTLRRQGGTASQKITATLASTTARSVNPWPNASAPTARSRKKEQTAAEISEQTQSLYSGADPGSGCELMFLQIPYPSPRSKLQVGVVLAHQDNDLGNQINQTVCQIIRALNGNQKADEALARLNQLLLQ